MPARRTGPGGVARPHQIGLRLTVEEHEALKTLALEAGVSVSDLLRRSPGQVETVRIALDEHLARRGPLNESELRALVSAVGRIVAR